jgi:hypothetical protein
MDIMYFGLLLFNLNVALLEITFMFLKIYFTALSKHSNNAVFHTIIRSFR